MSPEISNQQDPDQIYEIVPEANQETINDFLKSLEGEFDYPAFVHMSEDPSGPLESDPRPEEDDDEPDDEELEAEPVAPTTGQTPPVTTPDSVLVNGNAVSLSDIQRLYEFDQYLRQNPDAAERVQQAVTQPVVPAPANTPSPANEVVDTPPDFLDMDDPAHKFMWESHLAQQRQLATIQQQNIQSQQESLNQKALAEMDTALIRFRSAHPAFNDDQIIEMRRHAASMNVASSIMATSPNPVDGFVRILDLAALDHPDLRTVYLAPVEDKTPTRKQRSDTRKGKLNALGGSSGSVPRITPTSRPQSDREAIDQFAKELSDSFQQN